MVSPIDFASARPLVVELALLGDVLRIEGIGVGLIRIGRAMTENDHMSALAQGIDRIGLRRRRLAVGRDRQERKQRTPQESVE